MRFRVFTIWSLLLLGVSTPLSSVSSAADFEHDPYSGNVTDHSYQFLQFNRVSGSDVDTLRILDRQDHLLNSGNRSSTATQNDIDTNKTRAQDMVNMLKDEQMQKALAKITKKGNDVLSENPDLKNPGSVLAGAVALWYGRSIRLIKGEETHFFGRVEGRTRSGELSMQSPVLNSRLHFSAIDGFDLTVNRTISSINSQAEVVYSSKTQQVTTQMRHRLAPNLDLTFGVSQLPDTNQRDNRGGVYYNFNF